MTTGPDPDRLALASTEDQHTAADWEKATAAVLRKSGRLTDSDADDLVWRKLARRTLDGIEVAPIGTADAVADLPATGEPGAAPFTRGRTAQRPEIGWDIRAHHAGSDPKATNEALLVDLTNGVTSLWLSLSSDGLAPDDLEVVLDEVLLDLAPVVLDAPEDPVAAGRALIDVLEGRDVTAAEGTNLGGDPIGALMRGRPADTGVVAELADLARRHGTLALVVDAGAAHDLGASDAQELGYSLAVGAAYLRLLAEAGFGVDEALRLIEFRYAATPEQFPTIAKLRAARRCWARVAELSGASAGAGGQRQHAVTSQPAMSKYDPWVNMLRGTVGAFAAGVGGADAVTVVPFDATLGQPDAFGRRIARNTSSLLISESHVAKVMDPAGGSYAVERLTDELAEAAWAEFGRIDSARGEGRNGVEAALADGSLHERIAAVVAEREQQIAHRKRPITGLTEFPNLGEALPERAPHLVPDAVRRYGASFEALRDEPLGHVELITMGPIAAHTARATFAANLFAAGGIETDSPGALADVDAAVSAYGGSPVVCLCGTDAAYAEWGAALADALREAGARHVILAGRPGEKTIAAEKVDDFAAVGIDALAFLNRTREQF